MLLPNDQGPFSYMDHNILVVDKRPSSLNAPAPSPPSPHPLTIQEILSLANQLHSLPESYLTNAAALLCAVQRRSLG